MITQGTMTNYALLIRVADSPYIELNVTEKSTGKTGVASLMRNKGVYLFYGENDGSDDREVSIDEFNTDFETEICILKYAKW
ncbi:MAG: hypothetical protein ACI4C7_00015 [Clostridia bacterium]